MVVIRTYLSVSQVRTNSTELKHYGNDPCSYSLGNGEMIKEAILIKIRLVRALSV